MTASKISYDERIVRQYTMQDIRQIAQKIGLAEEDLSLYGNYKAKITRQPDLSKKGHLILLTAVNPTPAGEGKTTLCVGLNDAFNKLQQKSIVTIRQPSMGPVFGIKGGAAGGGKAQVVPMHDINLHFTGDFHAITSAHNLLAAILDNHIYQGNELNIDPKRITWRRVLDMNDRQLRHIVNGLGGDKDGVCRQDGFDITVTSEIMAVFCLAKDFADLRQRLGRMVVAFSTDNQAITCDDLQVTGALCALLRDAFKPNLVQSLEGSPAIIHGGPFANIAHGCNSVMATQYALALADYTVTEAGFGADLGAEKFINIKCRSADLCPDIVTLVVTTRSLKYNGGVAKEQLQEANLAALQKGSANLRKHIENIRDVFKLPCIVALNHFEGDYEDEIEAIRQLCTELGVAMSVCKAWEQGSAGAIDLAKQIMAMIEQQEKPSLSLSYADEDALKDKINSIVCRVYGGQGVSYSRQASQKIAQLEAQGFGHLPICIAKTQYSLSDDKDELGRPKGFTVGVNDIILNAGAGFIVVMTGNVLRMPGLPKRPAAEKIDIDDNEDIVGLF
ncbi:formate--tetrahydrofolate ligase [Brackiella oedipodis]|uniref:formate--tetrahydrofolate ligase n=1 Tax=Brackiella oedipodis TaxID=124225 RepID=UPI00056FDC14|nr:formate--tetrahydrofolate ligase [Brackiella oedipodis]